MASPVSVVSGLLKRAKPRHDDHWTDRVHYVLFPSFLLFLASLHGLKQYFGKPLECFPPAEISRWMNYVEGLCFVENTYFVSMSEPFPARAERQEREIHYYQWVPFLLAGQALLFILPKLLCKTLNGHTGLDIGSLLDRCYALDRHRQSDMDADKQQKSYADIGSRLDRTIHFNAYRRHRVGNVQQKGADDYPPPSPVVPLADNSVTLLYLGFKCMNLSVTISQLYFLNRFFAPDEYNLWGIGALGDLMAGKDWRQSGRFPRVSFCDVHIRQPQQDMPPLTFTFQCLLKMNLYNEKIFLLIWFCLAGFALFSCWDFLFWCHRLFSWKSTERFVMNQLLAQPPEHLFATSPSNLSSFVRDWIGHDGCTVFRLIDANCSPQVTAQIVGQLWQLFHRKEMLWEKEKTYRGVLARG